MKVCLLGASFDTNNMGVSALTAGTIACILESDPEADIKLLDYARQGAVYEVRWGGGRVPVEMVNMRFSKKLYLRNNIAMLLLLACAMKAIPSAWFRRKVLAHNPWLRKFCEADLVAAISGGDSFSDIYGMQRLFYVSLPQILALLLGKRLVLLPQTIGPFKSRTARAVARYILRGADTVYSRDREGLKAAAALLGTRGPSIKVRFCYDVAFALEPIAPPHVDVLGLPAEKTEGSCRVGLNVSGLLSMGGYNRLNMFGLRVDYSELIRSIIRLLIERKNATVLLVPHVFGTGSECDSPACERLYEAFKDKYPGRIGVVRGRYDQSEIKYIIGQCDFFIGSRMHACIAAVSQCVPAVSIAYSRKFVGVMATVGVESLVADPRKMDETEILNVVDQAFEQRAMVREQLQQKIPQVRETILRLFGEITESNASSQAQCDAGFVAVEK